MLKEVSRPTHSQGEPFSLQDQLALDTLIPNSIFKRYTAAILPPGSLDGGHGLHVEFPQLIVRDIEAFAK